MEISWVLSFGECDRHNFPRQGISSDQASFEHLELDFLATSDDDISARIYRMVFDRAAAACLRLQIHSRLGRMYSHCSDYPSATYATILLIETSTNRTHKIGQFIIDCQRRGISIQILCRYVLCTSMRLRRGEGQKHRAQTTWESNGG